MTKEFGTVDDNDQNKNDGTNFGDTLPADDNGGTEGDQGITTEELEALRTRDAAAQAHIPGLESENKDLRDKVVELETSLTNATNLKDVLEGTSNKGDQLTADAVTQIVANTLDQKQTQAKQDSNLESVWSALTTTYGDVKTADVKVQERAIELDIPLDDATTMARNNPKAFLNLFIPSTTAAPAGSAGVRSAGSGQNTVANTPITGDVRDKAYYQKLRRENPKYYWSLEGQTAYRRDVHPDE